MSNRTVALGVAGVAVVAVLALWLIGGPGGSGQVDVTVPELGRVAAAGQEAFEANCAECHGAAGGGTDQGPPLIHEIYEPSHHGDMAFVLAAERGVPAHHWDYGDMPPQPQVGERSIRQILAFVREVQRANGIE